MYATQPAWNDVINLHIKLDIHAGINAGTGWHRQTWQKHTHVLTKNVHTQPCLSYTHIYTSHHITSENTSTLDELHVKLKPRYIPACTSTSDMWLAVRTTLPEHIYMHAAAIKSTPRQDSRPIRQSRPLQYRETLATADAAVAEVPRKLSRKQGLYITSRKLRGNAKDFKCHSGSQKAWRKRLGVDRRACQRVLNNAHRDMLWQVPASREG